MEILAGEYLGVWESDEFQKQPTKKENGSYRPSCIVPLYRMGMVAKTRALFKNPNEHVSKYISGNLLFNFQLVYFSNSRFNSGCT